MSEGKKIFTVDDVTDEDRAVTAGEEDHSDPWALAGIEVDTSGWETYTEEEGA